MFETAHQSAGVDDFRQLFGILPVAVYTCDAPSGVITFYNEKAAQLWGRSPKLGDEHQRFCGSHRLWRPNGAPLPHHETPMALALNDGRQVRNEDVVIERPDGTRVHVLVNIDPIFDHSGRIVGAINAFSEVTDQDRAEASRETQRRLSMLMSNLPGAAYRCRIDENWTAEYVSDGVARLTGYKPAELLSHRIHWPQIVHPDDLASVRESINTSLRERRSAEVEYRIVHKSGALRWVLGQGEPVYDDRGNPIAIEGYIADVTERRQAEDALRAKDAELETIAETTPLILLHCTRDLRYQYVNRSAAALFGVRPSEMAGRPIVECMGQENFALIKPHIDNVLLGNHVQFEARLNYPAVGPRWVHVNYHPVCDRDGEVIGWIASIVDITDRKKMDAELRDSEERFRLAASAGKVGVWDCDITTNTVTWSEAIYEIFSIPPGTFGGTVESFIELVYPDDRDRVNAALQAALYDRAPYELEFRLERPSGELVWVHTNATVFYDNAGAPLRMVGATVDITGRKLAEVAAQTNSERYELVIQGAEAAIWDWDVVAKRVVFSPRWKELRGLADQEVSDNEDEWSSRIHPDDLDRVMAAVKAHFDGRTSVFSEEYRIHHKVRGWIWIQDRGIAMRDDAGNVVRMAGSETDITARKKAEEKLRASEERQRVATKAAGLGIFEWIAPSRETIFENDRMYEIFGITHKDGAIGRRRFFDEYLHPDDLDRVREAFREGTRRDKRLRTACRIRRQNETEWRWIELAGDYELGPNDEPLKLVCVVADVTERKQAEEALRVNEANLRELSERLRLLLDTTSHLIETIEAKELLPALLNLSREFVAADAFGLWRMDKGGDWHVANSTGLSEKLASETVRIASGFDIPTTPLVVQPEMLADRSMPIFRERWERYIEEGIQSMMILPLPVHGQITSALVFYCYTAHRFTPIEIESAQALANIAAAAITTSELYESQSVLRRRAEEAAVRGSFLAKAATIVTESLEFKKTLSNIARAAVPLFADWCSVDMLDTKGGLRRLAVAHADPKRVALAEWLHKKYPPRDDGKAGVLHVIRTGQPEMYPDIPRKVLEERAQNAEHLQGLRELNLRSYICVPLMVGGRACGALAFVRGESERRFDERDLEVAQEIAARAAQTIENARLYENLRQSEERYRLVVEGQLEMVCRFRPDGTILFANGAYARSQGLKPDQLLGQNLWRFVAHGDRARARAQISALKPDAPKLAIENRFATPEGVRWTLWTNHALAFDEAGHPTEVQASGIDITQRKVAEEALRKARDELEQRVSERTAELKRRARQLSRLTSKLTLTEQRERKRLAQVLHDHLQQILVAAKMHLSVLQRAVNGRESTEIGEVCSMLAEAIAASRSLTVELAPPILYEGGLAAGLDWLARWMFDKHALTVTVKHVLPVVSEREDIQILIFQSVRELLFNVTKHAGVNEATVELGLLEDDKISVVVSDKGCGFDAHAAMDVEGEDEVGFGLFSIRERLSLLGGQFQMESQIGRGSRFTLVAPALASSQDPPTSLDVQLGPGLARKKTTRRPRSRHQQIRVLLVDDHAVMRRGLAAVLASEKELKVIGEASDGLEAVEQAMVLQPDVILMDFSMPRLDGVEATRRIKSAMPHVVIIGLSIYEQFDRASAMIEAGASAYYTKSDNFDDLLKAIIQHGKAAHHVAT